MPSRPIRPPRPFRRVRLHALSAAFGTLGLAPVVPAALPSVGGAQAGVASVATARPAGRTAAPAVDASTVLPAPAPVRGADGLARVPFAVGERLNYEVRFGPLKVGTGTMHVQGVETVRGRSAYRTAFTVRGGTSFYKVDDRFESWFARDDLAALRFHKEQREGSARRSARFEIYPERATYENLVDRQGERPSVSAPLDDASFLYFVRTVPLEVGRTYRFDHYFIPDRNPVTLRVLRRERVTVPAGTFDAVVVQPIIKTKGIFSEGGQAQVWLSDDDRRLVLQVRSKLPFGSLNLHLTQATR